jgi:hypothetical protein
MPIGLKYEDRYEQLGHLSQDVLSALVKNDATPQEYKDFAQELLTGEKAVVDASVEYHVSSIPAILPEGYGSNLVFIPKIDQPPSDSVEKVQNLDEPATERTDALSVPSAIPDAVAPSDAPILDEAAVPPSADPVCSGDVTNCDKCAGVGTCLEHKD